MHRATPTQSTSGLQLPGIPALGALCVAAFAVCIASGVVLMTGFEPSRPVTSILAFETERPFGWFFRAVHAWSAQVALVALVAHTVDHVWRRSDRQTPIGTWVILVTSLPLTLYLMLGGRALAADGEGQGVAAVLHGIVMTTPLVGESFADLLVGPAAGGDPHVLLAHHTTTATLLLTAVTVTHIRKLSPDPVALGFALGLSGGLALAVRPELVTAAEGTRLRGPWYMGGLRLALEHAPVWLVGVMLPVAALAGLAVLAASPERVAGWLRVSLGLVAGAYAAVTLGAAWL